VQEDVLQTTLKADDGMMTLAKLCKDLGAFVSKNSKPDMDRVLEIMFDGDYLNGLISSGQMTTKAIMKMEILLGHVSILEQNDASRKNILSGYAAQLKEAKGKVQSTENLSLKLYDVRQKLLAFTGASNDVTDTRLVLTAFDMAERAMQERSWIDPKVREAVTSLFLGQDTYVFLMTVAKQMPLGTLFMYQIAKQIDEIVESSSFTKDGIESPKALRRTLKDFRLYRENKMYKAFFGY
jgi:hypothetical protein